MPEYCLSHFDSPIRIKGEVSFFQLTVLLQKIKIQESQIKNNNPDLIPSHVKPKSVNVNFAPEI